MGKIYDEQERFWLFDGASSNPLIKIPRLDSYEEDTPVDELSLPIIVDVDSELENQMKPSMELTDVSTDFEELTSDNVETDNLTDESNAKFKTQFTDFYYAARFNMSSSNKTKKTYEILGSINGRRKGILIVASALLVSSLFLSTSDSSSGSSREELNSQSSENNFENFDNNIFVPIEMSRENNSQLQVIINNSTTTTTTPETTTTIPATTTTIEITIPTTSIAPQTTPEVVSEPTLNEFGLNELITEFRGNYFDCNGRIVFGEIPGLWPSVVATRCDNVNGELGYTLRTIMENNPQLPKEQGIQALDYIKTGQLLNLGSGLPEVEFLGLREPVQTTVKNEERSDSTTVSYNNYGIESYRKECSNAGGTMGSSSSSTLTEYITKVLGRSSAEANGFSKIHPILASGWSRFGDDNYCLLGNVDLSIYD